MVSRSEGSRAVRLRVQLALGDNVRPTGTDIPLGAHVLSKGVKVGPAELGVLATLGIQHVSVISKAVVGVLSTGNEIVSISTFN